MPELRPEQRAAGGYAGDQVDVDHDRDWSVPTDYETLRRRPPRTVLDQDRYGRATTDPRPARG